MKHITDEDFKASINRIASSEDGKVFFACLRDALGWDNIYLSSESAEVTQYHAIRRGVYASLRTHIKPEFLKDIEFNYKRKAEINGTSKRRNSIANNRNSGSTTNTK